MTTLGVKITNTGEQALDQPGMAAMARVAEQNGAESGHISDHVVLVEGSQSHYPFSADGVLPWPNDLDVYDPLVACGWIAAATETLRPTTSVLVLPMRHPLALAKTVATIDRLSGGRMVLGVGAGWLAEEFNALGWDFATRGRRMDESIEVLRRAWTGDTAAFDGEHFQFDAGVHCRPLPVRDGGVPLLIGGMGQAAFRRSARVGDGWLALVDLHRDLGGRQRADGLARLAAKLADLEARLAAIGRDRGDFHAAVKLIGVGPDQLELLPEVACELAAIGFDEVVVDPMWRDLEEAAAVVRECRAALDG
ncbi:TIGR03619 family F420-dependent LLM class oxidoreductase [Parasphingorhabdus pacifica]